MSDSKKNIVIKGAQSEEAKIQSEEAKILAIETSTSACSVALRSHGEVHVLTEVGNNLHSQKVLPQIQTLLREASWQVQDLEAVAIGHGPGSFTGLRIGVGVAQGVSYGAACPMLGVSSLAALAMSSQQDGDIKVAIDARMGEIYYAHFNKQLNQLQLIGKEVVCAPKSLQYSAAEELIGNGWGEYWHELDTRFSANFACPDLRYPSAREVLLLAEQDFTAQKFVDPKVFAPVYVRNDVAKKPINKVTNS